MECSRRQKEYPADGLERATGTRLESGERKRPYFPDAHLREEVASLERSHVGVARHLACERGPMPELSHCGVIGRSACACALRRYDGLRADGCTEHAATSQNTWGILVLSYWLTLGLSRAHDLRALDGDSASDAAVPADVRRHCQESAQKTSLGYRQRPHFHT